MDKYDVMLSWVSVQDNVEGKEIADELARQSSPMDIGNADMSIRPPVSHLLSFRKK